MTHDIQDVSHLIINTDVLTECKSVIFIHLNI